MKNIYFLLLLAISSGLTAQDQHCATDVVMKKVYEKDPALKLRKQKQDEARRDAAHRAAANSTYLIPVVFHVLHVGGPENISDAQVKDGLRILNRDYAKQNPDTTEIIPVFKNLADSTKIQFALATKDPAGNCTNGIVHHYDTDTDWDENSSTLFSHTWDPTKYMNVYLVRTITLNGGFGASGYTYLPGTWSSGDPFDAIVVLNNYFGTIGTGSNFLSRVLTHEAGHWLDLNHVFGGFNSAGADCSGDDFINDTPVTPGYLNCPNASIPSQYQICTPGVSENYQNYMDYSYCVRMFTKDQATHMQQTLQSPVSGRDNLWTTANLISTGILNPNTPCIPVADFKYNRSKTCAATAVAFTDASWNGTPSSYTWTFQGGTPSTSSFSAPVITYANPGLFSVTYATSNSAGTSASVVKSNIITVTNNTAQFNNFWTEGFENLSTLNSDWTIVTSSGSAKWEQSSSAFYSGIYSAQIAPANNTRKTITSMISPAVNMGTNPGPTLSFKVATAEVTPNHVNTLKVYSSIDCGQTWNPIYSKSGQALITSNSSASGFIPQKNEWRTEIINLQQLTSASYVNFKFEYTRDTIPAANNIFIDDINLSGPVSIKENDPELLQNLEIYPVPSKGEISISFNLPENKNVRFSVYDISGRLIQSTEDANYRAGQHLQKINSENKIPAGIYFLKIEIGGTQYTRKIIIGD